MSRILHVKGHVYVTRHRQGYLITVGNNKLSLLDPTPVSRLHSLTGSLVDCLEPHYAPSPRIPAQRSRDYRHHMALINLMLMGFAVDNYCSFMYV